MSNQVLTDIGNRYKQLDDAVKRGRLDLPTAIHNYAWLARKDLGPGHLAMGNLNAALSNEANDSDASIPFVISTYAEDRDGDVVVPMGCRLHNYVNNPVVFFGHQDNPLPIAKSMNPNGGLTVFPEENRIWAVAYFDKADEDAMNIYGKVKRGFLSATSIAFVPIVARRRDDIHKAHQHEGSPGGWVFDEIDTTEWSVVGVPSNPQATVLQKNLRGELRDLVDSERRSTSPRLLKALEPYCAKSINESGGCWSGWCPLPSNVSKRPTSQSKAVAKAKPTTTTAKAAGCSCHSKTKSAPREKMAGDTKKVTELMPGDSILYKGYEQIIAKVEREQGGFRLYFTDGTKSGIVNLSTKWIMNKSLPDDVKAIGPIQVGDVVWVDAFDRGKVTFLHGGKATVQFSDGTRDEYPLSRLDKGIKKTQLDMEHGTTAGEIDLTKSAEPMVFQIMYTTASGGRGSSFRKTRAEAEAEKRRLESGNFGIKLVEIDEVPERLAGNISIKRGKGMAKDLLEGGVGDQANAQLEEGIRVEMEHTDDPDVAREIAMDHLAEDPAYYSKLRLVEGKSKRGKSMAKYITIDGVRYKSMSESSGADGGFTVPAEQKSGPDVEYDQGYVAAWDGRARSTNPYRTDEDGRGPEMRADWDAGWVDGAKERLTGKKQAKRAVRKAMIPVSDINVGDKIAWRGADKVVDHVVQGTMIGTVRIHFTDGTISSAVSAGMQVERKGLQRRKFCSFCRGTGSGCGRPGDCPTCAGKGWTKGIISDILFPGPGKGFKVGDKVTTPFGPGTVTWVKTSRVVQIGMDDLKVKLDGTGEVMGLQDNQVTRKSLRRKGFTDILPFLDYGIPEQWVMALMALGGITSAVVSRAPALIQAIKDAWDRGASPQQAAQEVSNNMKQLRVRKSSLRAGDKVVDETGSGGVVISSEVRNGKVFVDVRLSDGQVVDYIQDQLRKKSLRKGLDEEQTMGMDEPMVHTPHETAIADLYKRAKDEHAYITEQLGSITPFDPQTGDANKAHADLKEYGDQVGQRLESLKAMFGAHSEKDIDDIDDIAKGDEVDELTDEAQVDKSEVGGEEWAEEEANEPQHMELDDVEMGMVTSGDGIANTGEANLVDRGEIPPDATMGLDDELQMSEDDDVTKAAEDEQLEKDLNGDLDEDIVEATEGEDHATEEVLERYQETKGWEYDKTGTKECAQCAVDIIQGSKIFTIPDGKVLCFRCAKAKGKSLQWRTRKASTSTIAKVLRAGGSVKRGLDGRRWLVVRSVRKSPAVECVDCGWQGTEAQAGKDNEGYPICPKCRGTLTEKSLKHLKRRKDLTEQSPDQVQMDLDPAHAEAIKACGAMMKGLAVAHDMPEHHKSALDMHGDALAKALNEGGYEEALAKALKHLKSLSGAPDVPEHHKAAMGHHSKGIGKVLKAMGTEEEPAPVEEAEGEKQQVAKADENDQVAKALMDSLRDSALMLERTSHRVGIKV